MATARAALAPPPAPALPRRVLPAPASRAARVFAGASPPTPRRRRRRAPGSTAAAFAPPPDHAATGEAYEARLFVNLKNGLEAVPALRSARLPHAFVRIQSTMCEVGDMEKVIGGLDDNFLLAAALGYSCVVVDYGSRDKKRGVPRAVWYGLEFVRFALDEVWHGGASRRPVLRGKAVERDFARKLRGLSKSARKRLKYYRRFIPADARARGAVRLVGAFGRTEHDDDDAYYARVLGEACAPGTSGGAARGGARGTAAELANFVSESAGSEAEAMAALRGLGLEAFYGGDAEEEWLAQLAGGEGGERGKRRGGAISRRPEATNANVSLVRKRLDRERAGSENESAPGTNLFASPPRPQY